MDAIIQILTDIVSESFALKGYDKKLGQVTASDRADLCHFQCNGAFEGAKLYKKAPIKIALEVAQALEGNAYFEKVEAIAPGFLNLTLKNEYMVKKASEVFKDANSGVQQTKAAQTIVIDYGGPNVAKSLHIGHLRSAIIGESLKRLALACGHKVIGDVHLGDWGLQIGLVIAELESRYPDWECFGTAFKSGDSVPALSTDNLNEMYPLASKKSKEDINFKKRAQQITKELQQGRAGYIALWKEIMRVSVSDLKKSYSELNVDFDLWYGESDAEQYVDELISILESKNLLKISQGATIVELEEETDTAPMPPAIIKKSDDSYLYATTDLATIIQRQKDFNPDKIWYVVDNRQNLHFTQVFRCAKKAGIVSDKTEFEFLGFGTMNGSDGKPYKTRDGGIMRLSDLIETATNAALNKLNGSSFQSDISESEKALNASKIGIAALKFGDLINHRTKDSIFDLEKFLAFEGKTGPYILYTISRMNSILKKVEVPLDSDFEIKDIYSNAEKDLLLKIILIGDVFKKAFEEKAPNYISENAYLIASAFSRFYHDSRVIDEKDEEKKKSWISLILLTRKVLLKHLDVLAIDYVENM